MNLLLKLHTEQLIINAIKKSKLKLIDFRHQSSIHDNQ